LAAFSTLGEERLWIRTSRPVVWGSTGWRGKSAVWAQSQAWNASQRRPPPRGVLATGGWKGSTPLRMIWAPQYGSSLGLRHRVRALHHATSPAARLRTGAAGCPDFYSDARCPETAGHRHARHRTHMPMGGSATPTQTDLSGVVNAVRGRARWRCHADRWAGHRALGCAGVVRRCVRSQGWDAYDTAGRICVRCPYLRPSSPIARAPRRPSPARTVSPWLARTQCMDRPVLGNGTTRSPGG
jgi:hypothetical protein